MKCYNSLKIIIQVSLTLLTVVIHSSCVKRGITIEGINKITQNATLGKDKGAEEIKGMGNFVFNIDGITHVMPYAETKKFSDGLLYSQQLLFYNNLEATPALLKYLAYELGDPNQAVRMSGNATVVVWGHDSIDRGVRVLADPNSTALYISVVSVEKKLGEGFWK